MHEQCTLPREILVVHRGDAYSNRVLELATELGEHTKASLSGLAIAEYQQKAEEIAQQMRGYLRFHDVKAEFMTRLGFTAANILKTASAQDCDLIAVSASHHGKLHGIIFQSTTGGVVKMANRAVMAVR